MALIFSTIESSTINIVQVSKKNVSAVTEAVVEIPFEVICTIPLKPYSGLIRVTYLPMMDGLNVKLLEWNSLAEWVKSLRSEHFIAEELANLVAWEIFNKAEPQSVLVEVEIESAFHLPVIVRAELCCL